MANDNVTCYINVTFSQEATRQSQPVSQFQHYHIELVLADHLNYAVVNYNLHLLLI